MYCWLCGLLSSTYRARCWHAGTGARHVCCGLYIRIRCHSGCQCCTNAHVTAVLGTVQFRWRLVGVVVVVGGSSCLSAAPQCLRGRRHPDSPTGLRLQLGTGAVCLCGCTVCLFATAPPPISPPLSFYPKNDFSEMEQWLPPPMQNRNNNPLLLHFWSVYKLLSQTLDWQSGCSRNIWIDWYGNGCK